MVYVLPCLQLPKEVGIQLPDRGHSVALAKAAAPIPASLMFNTSREWRENKVMTGINLASSLAFHQSLLGSTFAYKKIKFEGKFGRKCLEIQLNLPYQNLFSQLYNKKITHQIFLARDS